MIYPLPLQSAFGTAALPVWVLALLVPVLVGVSRRSIACSAAGSPLIRDRAAVARPGTGRPCATLGAPRTPRTSTTESTPSAAVGCAPVSLQEGTTAMVTAPHSSGPPARVTAAPGHRRPIGFAAAIRERG